MSCNHVLQSPPAGAPADGADGADVHVVCDPSLDNLLHLHKSKQWFAQRGAKGNPAAGSSGPKRNAKIKKSTTPPLEIPVPQGTVIKRKSNGQVMWQPTLTLLVWHTHCCWRVFLHLVLKFLY